MLMFVDTACPCVQAYDARVKALKAKYGKRGFGIIYIFAKPGESQEKMRHFMQKKRYNWVAAPDPKQKLLKLFNAQCSSETFLADARGVLRYHGALDDSTFDPAAVQKPYLENALTALYARRRVAIAETPAHGCAIPRIS